MFLNRLPIRLWTLPVPSEAPWCNLGALGGRYFGGMSTGWSRLAPHWAAWMLPAHLWTHPCRPRSLPASPGTATLALRCSPRDTFRRIRQQQRPLGGSPRRPKASNIGKLYFVMILNFLCGPFRASSGHLQCVLGPPLVPRMRWQSHQSGPGGPPLPFRSLCGCPGRPQLHPMASPGTQNRPSNSSRFSTPSPVGPCCTPRRRFSKVEVRKI